MNSVKLYIVSLIFRFIPQTRLFGLKSWLLRWCGAKIGKNVRICSSVVIQGSGDLEIGHDTWIGPQTFILCSALVRIGNYVDIGPQVYIGTGTHLISREGLHSAGEGVSKSIEICDGVWLGARSMILPGVKVGTKAVLGAAAVALEDVPEGVICVGVPARELRKL